MRNMHEQTFVQAESPIATFALKFVGKTLEDVELDILRGRALVGINWAAPFFCFVMETVCGIPIVPTNWRGRVRGMVTHLTRSKSIRRLEAGEAIEPGDLVVWKLKDKREARDTCAVVTSHDPGSDRLSVVAAPARMPGLPDAIQVVTMGPGTWRKRLSGVYRSCVGPYLEGPITAETHAMAAARGYWIRDNGRIVAYSDLADEEVEKIASAIECGVISAEYAAHHEHIILERGKRQVARVDELGSRAVRRPRADA